MNAIHEEHSRRTLEDSYLGLDRPLSTSSLRAVYTAVAAAQNDPYGDGDQSQLPNPTFHPLRESWATGLDAQTAVLAEEEAWEMNRSAWEPDLEEVNELIEKARQKEAEGDHGALTRVLERRLSLMRLSPLHYACFSARSRANITEEGSQEFVDVVEALCRAGARVDSRDIAGYTPLSVAAGFMSNSTTIRMAEVLISYGANVNARTRFGESILVPTIMGANVDSFRTLLRNGADLMQKDRTGLTPRKMAARWPALLTIINEVEREQALARMACDACGEKGVNKFCAACRTVFYCSRECQKAGWRAGHRDLCGKSACAAHRVDVSSDMITNEMVPGFVGCLHTNPITGVSSSKRISPKAIGKPFVLKVKEPLVVGDRVGCVRLSIRNSDFLLLKKGGPGRAAYATLTRVVREGGKSAGRVFLSAKFVRKGEEAEVENGSNEHGEGEDMDFDERFVLRIDTSTILPPPTPVW